MRLYAKNFFRIDETTMQKRITDDSEPPKAELPPAPKAPSEKCGNANAAGRLSESSARNAAGSSLR